MAKATRASTSQHTVVFARCWPGWLRNPDGFEFDQFNSLRDPEIYEAIRDAATEYQRTHRAELEERQIEKRRRTIAALKKREGQTLCPPTQHPNLLDVLEECMASQSEQLIRIRREAGPGVDVDAENDCRDATVERIEAMRSRIILPDHSARRARSRSDEGTSSAPKKRSRSIHAAHEAAFDAAYRAGWAHTDTPDSLFSGRSPSERLYLGRVPQELAAEIAAAAQSHFDRHPFWNSLQLRFGHVRLDNAETTRALLNLKSAERAESNEQRLYWALAVESGLVVEAVRQCAPPTVPPKPKKPRAQRRSRPRKPRTVPTKQQTRAYGIYLRTGTYSGVGEELGISRQAATRLVKDAEGILNKAGRSVSARRALPKDHLGQSGKHHRRRRKGTEED